MKKLVIKGNGLLPLLLFILWGGSVLAQHHTVLGGFEYNNIYYKANVKGLKMFIDDVPMPDDLKLSLTEQMNQIKKQNNF